MNTLNNAEESISIREYIDIFRKRGWILAVITCVSILISGILNFFVIEPVYQAQLTFMVNFNTNENAAVTKEDMDYGTTLVETYKPIIKSKKVTKTIKENLGLNISQEEIGNSITITSISGPVMSVTAQNTNPILAAKIANEVPDVFSKELKRIAKVDGIEVIDNASVPTSPVSPNKTKNIIMAGIAGVVISIFIMLLLECLDNKIKTEDDIERYLDLPVLGSVSEFQKSNKKSKKKRRKKVV